MEGKLSIIYDITKRCPWNCKMCCMNAARGCEALMGELPMDRKLSLISEMAEINKTRDVYVDFSGGEIMTNLENICVVEKAAMLMGKEKIGISSSGYKMTDDLAKRLSASISNFEMTMDVLPGRSYELRPFGYSLAAANAIPYLKKYGIEVGIQTVLARQNCNEANLRELYQFLCENGVDDWSLLKFYPSGRGENYKHEVLSEEDETWAVRFIKGLDASNSSEYKPRVDFHYRMKNHEKHSTECRCVRKSIGILPDGLVTSCFWAIDADQTVSDDRFNLGSVKTESLVDILNGPKAAYWMDCVHCCELEELRKRLSLKTA